MSGDESWVGPPTTAILRAGSEPVALGAAHDLPRVGQCGETFIQGAGADAAQRAQFPDGKWAVRCGDRGSDSFVDGGRRGGRAAIDWKVSRASASPRCASSSVIVGGDGAARCSTVSVSS